MQRSVPTTAHGGRLTNIMNDHVFDALADEQRRTLPLDLLESDPQDAGFESPTGESAPIGAEQQTQMARPLLEWGDDHADMADQHGQFEL